MRISDWSSDVCSSDLGRAALGERRDEIGAPGRAVGVDDHGMNVVECDTADFLALFLDDEEAAIQRQMAAIGGDIDNAVHERRPQAIIHAGRDRKPGRADRYGSGGPWASKSEKRCG